MGGTASAFVGLMFTLLACPSCPTQLEARAQALSDLLPFLGMLIVPLGLMAALIALASRGRPLLGASMVLGLGMGGFLDGIVLHQILQWHNMMSSKVPPEALVAMKYNMVFDGVFHVATWLAVALGVVLLFRCGQRGVAFDGWVLAAGSLWGWGLFNSIEGLFDHQLYGLHHVHPGVGQLAWDIGFIMTGPVLGVLGALALLRGGHGATGGRLRHA